ncbi:hypothetical protein ZWY2020_055271 [Hordeum vulgare]|nr:hypothetical protein ZWY2020_055271 [Hordeum vulgare]
MRNMSRSLNLGVALALPFCSAAPTPCSPLCAVTAAVTRVLRRVNASALRSFAADPLVAQAVPDLPLFSDSAILSPYATAPDDIVRGFAFAAELVILDEALRAAAKDALVGTQR